MHEILYKYKASSDDVQRIRTLTSTTFSKEICPFENLTMEIVSAQ